jgi:xylulokinase
LILSFHVVPGRWRLQGGTTGGGGALKWLRETVCPELSFEQMSTLAETIAPGSDGVTFLPYLAGERSPIWNPDASGVFFGLNYTVTRAHLIRAVMESIAYALRHNLETAANAGAEAAVLRTTGGSANSRVWTQMKADVTGMAGVGTRVYADFASAVAKTVAVRRSHRANPDRREVYEKGYRRYRELYDRLRPMMIRSDKA